MISSPTPCLKYSDCCDRSHPTCIFTTMAVMVEVLHPANWWSHKRDFKGFRAVSCCSLFYRFSFCSHFLVLLEFIFKPRMCLCLSIHNALTSIELWHFSQITWAAISCFNTVTPKSMWVKDTIRYLAIKSIWTWDIFIGKRRDWRGRSGLKVTIVCPDLCFYIFIQKLNIYNRVSDVFCKNVWVECRKVRYSLHWGIKEYSTNLAWHKGCRTYDEQLKKSKWIQHNQRYYLIYKAFYIYITHNATQPQQFGRRFGCVMLVGANVASSR